MVMSLSDRGIFTPLFIQFKNLEVFLGWNIMKSPTSDDQNSISFEKYLVFLVEFVGLNANIAQQFADRWLVVIEAGESTIYCEL